MVRRILMNMPTVISGVYHHYKGNDYEVLGVARHSETNEDFVIYRALYGNRDYFVRPLAQFFEEVEYEGKMVPRFKYMKES